MESSIFKTDGTYLWFDGIKYKKRRKYWMPTNTRKYRESLHRAVYRALKGEIPAGFDVHHIDSNMDNNHIDNLAALSRQDHRKAHVSAADRLQKACGWCNRAFECIQKNARFCSRRCRGQHRYKSPENSVSVKCVKCGSVFLRNKSARGGCYCSVVCGGSVARRASRI